MGGSLRGTHVFMQVNSQRRLHEWLILLVTWSLITKDVDSLTHPALLIAMWLPREGLSLVRHLS